MAITRAQIARELYIKGGVVNPDGRRGFGGGADMGASSKGYQGGASKGPSSKSPSGNTGYTGAGGGADAGGLKSPGGGTFKPPAQKYIPGPGDTGSDDPPSPIAPPEKSKKEENILNDFLQALVPSRKKFYKYATSIPGSTDRIIRYRKAYADYLTGLGIEPTEELLDTENLYDYFDKQAFEKNLKPADAGMEAPMNYGDFIAENFGAPGVKYSGNIGNLQMFVKERDPITGKPTKYGYREKPNDDGPDPIIPLQTGITSQAPGTTDLEPDPNSLEGLLANRGIAFRFMADGGMTEDAIGGAAEGDIDEMGRQMYGLGKLVKKATRAVKKIVKSPIGKAALLYGGFKFGPQILSGKGFGLGSIKKFSDLKFLGEGANVNMSRLFGLTSLAPIIFGDGANQDEEDRELYRGPGLDIAGIRQDPYAAMGSAYGFYADGGDVKEPVAKKTMPLLDMGGMEKDYRADGGFVPIGRMERADDVPARLSKNEFVFTADAVRNAGDGDIDKGAEVMYNMMKNLEAGGDVSEESQGLKGARDMFQTSQRLEEVL